MELPLNVFDLACRIVTSSVSRQLMELQGNTEHKTLGEDYLKRYAALSDHVMDVKLTTKLDIIDNSQTLSELHNQFNTGDLSRVIRSTIFTLRGLLTPEDWVDLLDIVSLSLDYQNKNEITSIEGLPPVERVAELLNENPWLVVLILMKHCDLGGDE